MRSIRRIHTVVGLVLIFAVSACFSVEVASIHEAAKLGDLDKVKAFLDQGIDINAKNERGQAAMHVAVNGKQKKITELLITKGGDVNVKDKWGYTPLYYAIWNEDANMVSLLVDKGADVNVRVNGDGTPLVYAVWNEDIDMARLFVNKGAKLDVKDDEGMTAFHYAVLQANREFVEFFVDKGADFSGIHGAACMGDLAKVKNHLEKGTDVDIKDEVGWTPLYWAVSMGQTGVAELLIAEGADVGINAKDGSTTLHQAARAGAVTLVRLLIDKGIDVNVKETYGNTPLHAAASKGHSLVSEVLINYGAEVNARARNDSTPLHRAVLGGHPDVVKVLMGRSADVNAKDKRGLTALDWAMRGDHTELVELLLVNKSAASAALVSDAQNGNQKSVVYLLDRGADVNFQNDLGLSPLHVAASKQDKDAVALFLTHQALVNVKDKAGRTPLHYAVGAKQLLWEPKDGDIEAARLLLDHGADINVADNVGKTPLYYSVRLGEKMTKLLLDRGADPNYVDPRGEKPLPSEHGETFYVATDGDDSNFGTREHPLKTVYTAIMIARPGDTIYVRGGRYSYSHTVLLEKSGRQDEPIRISAYPGETPVFDFSTTPGYGFIIRSAYWRIKGITVTNSGNEGIHLVGQEAHHNILEQITANSCSRTGICVTGRASHNLILNCDTYRNFEFLANGENGGGFVVNFSGGIGNILIGNRAWNNSDDGYDFWDMDESVRLEQCYSWRNGENLWDYPFFTGNGNGFKLGRGKGRHILINCVAWNHHLGGFNLNGNETGVILYGCSSLGNLMNNNFYNPPNGAKNTILRNNLSYQGQYDQIADQVDSQFNSWDSTIDLKVVEDDFVSLDDSVMSAPRNPDGSIPQNDFLKLAPGSAAIDKGADVNMPYVGKAPDLGAFEYDPNEASDRYVKMLHQAVRDHDVKQIEQLLAQGEGIDEKDWLGYTPLHWAVYFGYPDLIELLISKGADPDVQSNTGRYALEIARAMAYPELEALLRKLGAKAGDVSTNEGSQETESAEKQEAIGKKPSS